MSENNCTAEQYIININNFFKEYGFEDGIEEFFKDFNSNKVTISNSNDIKKFKKMSLLLANIEVLIKDNFSYDNITDGDHTFEELYFHRMILFSIICKQNKENAWRFKLHADGTMFDDYFIAGINTRKGQYSYHYNEKHWGIFEGVKILENAPEYDGHKPYDLNRLNSLLKK